jgi:hypothetical protein
MFRFPDAAVYFHEEEKEGLAKICQLALHRKYPKYAADGYEVLYPRPPVIYVSAAAKPNLGQYLCHQVLMCTDLSIQLLLLLNYVQCHMINLFLWCHVVCQDCLSSLYQVYIINYLLLESILRSIFDVANCLTLKSSNKWKTSYAEDEKI